LPWFSGNFIFNGKIADTMKTGLPEEKNKRKSWLGKYFWLL